MRFLSSIALLRQASLHKRLCSVMSAMAITPKNWWVRVLPSFYVTLLALSAVAWTVQGMAQNTTVGIQPFGSYQGTIDQINLQDLGVHIDIPLYVHKARGANNGLSVHLIYDTSYFGSFPITANTSGADVGWRVVAATEGGGGSISGGPTATHSCAPKAGVTDPGIYITYGKYSFTDATGYVHNFAGTWTDNQCNGGAYGPPTTSLSELASDGSGYLLNAASGNSSTVTAPSGIIYSISGSEDTTGNSGYISGPPDTTGNQTVTVTDTSNISVTISGGGYYYNSNGAPTSRAPTPIQYTDTSGTSRQIVVNYTMYNQPNYGLTGLGMVSSVNFPDGSSYNFTYQSPVAYISTENSDGIQTQYLALLQSVQLPTGGTITYTNSYPNAGTPVAPCNVEVKLTRATSYGSTTYHKVSTQANCFSTTTVLKADGSSEQVSFITGAPGYLETTHQWYNSSNGLMKSTSRCYNSQCPTTSYAGVVSSISTTTTLASGLSSQTTQLFNNLLPTELDEYDYGASALTRKTVTSYAALGSNISDRPQSVTVYDGSSNVIGQTTYGYDEYSLKGLSLSSTSGLPQHYAVSGARGNLTSVHQWVNTTNSTLDTHYRYDDAGQVIAKEDPHLNWTLYTYDSATDSCLQKTTLPSLPAGVTLSSSATCDSNTGLLSTATDANGIKTQYSYDSMLRPAGITVTSGGATVFQNSITTSTPTITNNILTAPMVITTITAATPSPSEVSTVTLDGYGRTSQASAPSGAIVATTYDSMGRVYTVSNPYFSSNTSPGLTTYLYDALSRPVSETFPDQSVRTWCYDGVATANHSTCPGNAAKSATGSVVNFWNERGNQWQRVTDGLGRLTGVMEPSATTGVAALETDYSYDVLNNLKGTNQAGVSGETARQRSFSYDSLSRVVTAANSETGSVGYAYLNSSGALCAGDPTLPCSKTDARGISTSYAYDALNRVLSKTYSDGTPFSCYLYDSASANGAGRLAQEWTQAVSCPAQGTGASTGVFSVRSILGYDGMGRETGEQQCTPGKCATASGPKLWYGYDLAGNPTCLTDSVGAGQANPSLASNNSSCLTTNVGTPSGLLQTTGFDSGGHTNSVTSNWGAFPTSLYTLGTNGYGPVGPLNWTLGSNLAVTQGYSNRLWVNSITATGPTQ